MNPRGAHESFPVHEEQAATGCIISPPRRWFSAHVAEARRRQSWQAGRQAGEWSKYLSHSLARAHSVPGWASCRLALVTACWSSTGCLDTLLSVKSRAVYWQLLAIFQCSPPPWLISRKSSLGCFFLLQLLTRSFRADVILLLLLLFCCWFVCLFVCLLFSSQSSLSQLSCLLVLLLKLLFNSINLYYPKLGNSLRW